MSKGERNTKGGPHKLETSKPNVRTEAVAAPESDWFFAWLKSAGLYLAAVATYLGAVKVVVFLWQKLFAFQGEKPSLAIWVLSAIIASPLILAFLFNLRPAMRRRRERNLRPTGSAEPEYFTTSPREDDRYGFFAKGYEQFLEWTHTPKSPLLHLTGLSGSGKSSLIGAYLKPHLANPESGPKTIVFVIRSYTDPLAMLKESLLALWKQKPADYDELSPFDAIYRAARQLGGNDRLLVAFDQFEEFFLLRATANDTTQRHDETSTVTSSELEALGNFLHTFLSDPPDRVVILLSYREDHRRLLAPLQLMARREGHDWMTVDPLDFATATTFLRSCPGLAVPESRLRLVLREAARQESGRVVMRPIVANILGIILQRMSGHPSLWRRSNDLLRGYVRDILRGELEEDRIRVLRALLTDFHTSRPRAVTEIARESHLDPATLEAQLQHLGRAGLLRCVNLTEADPSVKSHKRLY